MKRFRCAYSQRVCEPALALALILPVRLPPMIDGSHPVPPVEVLQREIKRQVKRLPSLATRIQAGVMMMMSSIASRDPMPILRSDLRCQISDCLKTYNYTTIARRIIAWP